MPHADPVRAREYNTAKHREYRDLHRERYRAKWRRNAARKRKEQGDAARVNWLAYCARNPQKVAIWRARAEKKRHGENLLQTLKRTLSHWNYRARRHDAPGECTVQQWLSRVALYGWRCAYCKLPTGKLTPDHVKPLVQGGSNWPSNLVPCCKRCNSAKGPRRWRPSLPPCLENK